MAQNIGLFDTSNFDPYNPFYSTHIQQVLGKIKSQTGSTFLVKFVGFEVKVYSLSCGVKSKKSQRHTKTLH